MTVAADQQRVALRDLRALPKVDLHVHLEGSMRSSTLLELCERDGRRPPPALGEDGYHFVDFLDFLAQYAAACACLSRIDDFRRIAYEFCEDEAREGVRWAEVTFTPLGHALRLGDWDGPIAAVLDGFAQGERDFGITCRVVIDHAREVTPALAEPVVDLALRYRDRGVISFGLGGDERFPPGLFVDAFARAREGGLRSVPHAGEGAGPESVRDALDQLGAERIGHGVRSIEDPDLVARLRREQVPLEVCPTSNIATGVVASIEEHPLPRLLEAGLCVTLASDDPEMFHSPLSGEYLLARDVFGLDDGALAGIARNGVRASFAPDSLKADLETAIDDWLVAASPTAASAGPE